MVLKIYTDGSVTPEKTRTAWYIIGGIQHIEEIRPAPVLIAELTAIKKGIELAINMKQKKATIISDSRDAIWYAKTRQRTRRESIQIIKEEIRELMSNGTKIKLKWTSRENNPAGKCLETIVEKEKRRRKKCQKQKNK